MLSRPKKFLGVIIVIGILLRLIYFFQFSNSALIAQHHWAVSDMRFFFHWAKLIEAGDVLTNRSLHPYHDWHNEIAINYFNSYPPEGFDNLSEPEKLALYKSFWSDYYKGARFHQAPFYPYLLAGMFKLFGSDVFHTYALQLMFGLLSLILVFKIGKELHSEQAGVIASLLLCLSGVLLFYEMVLLRTTLIIFANCLLCLQLIQAERFSNKQFFVFGLLSGLAYLLKPTLIVYGAAAAALCVFKNRKALVPLTAGVLLCLLPLVYRNYTVSAPLFSVSSVGPITFISSNTPKYHADLGFMPSREHVPIALKNSDGSLLSSAKASLELFDSPTAYLKLVLNKLHTSIRWFEEANNVNFYFYKLHTPVLAWLPIGFPLLFCLGVLGIFFSLKNIKKIWPLHILLLPSLAILIVLYPISRFRIVAFPALAIFSAIAIIELIEMAKSKKFRAVAASAIFVIASGLYVCRTLPPTKVLVRGIDYINPHRYYYQPLIQLAQKEGNFKLAAEMYEESFIISPKFIVERQDPSDWSERGICFYYAELFKDYAFSLEKAGNLSKAEDVLAFSNRLTTWAKINHRERMAQPVVR